MRDPSLFEMRDVIISEFMVRQHNTLADPDFHDYSGWIELYNRESEPVDLSGWIVAGKPLSEEHDKSYSLPDGATILPDEYLIVWTGGRDVPDDETQAIHASFRLPADGGMTGLYGPEWAESPVIDTISYDARQVVHDISLGRIVFGDHSHKGFLLPMNLPTPGAPNRLARLQLIRSYSLDISDPSGLDVDHTGNYFWTISDDPGGSIYKIDRQGQIVDELPVGGDDMEAITQHPKDRTLYVAEERLREIVQYDTLGNELARFPVDVEIQRENDGLEGITVNPANNHIFTVNEQNPRVLIELDLQKDQQDQQIMYKHINFGAGDDAGGLDLSGLFFDETDDVLWVVSDEARAAFMLDPKGRALAAYNADPKESTVRDLEGIAIIREEGLMFMVSDEMQQLFLYRYPDPLRNLSVTE